MDRSINKIVRIVSLSLITLLIMYAISSSFIVVKPGNVGVIFNKINGSLSSAPQGFVLRVPFVTEVQNYPVSLRTYSMVANLNEGSSQGDDSIDLPTKEGQHIRQDLSVTYNTSEKQSTDVFRSFKGAGIEEIESTFIRRTIITTAQNVAGQMSLTELISSGRGRLQEEISKILRLELGKMGFLLDKVNVGGSHLPESIEKQMQEKMAAQQSALQAEYELQKQQSLARAGVAKAEGVAKAMLINADAQAKSNKMLQQSMTPLIIEKMKVEKWNGVMPQIMSSAIPIINFKPTKD